MDPSTAPLAMRAASLRRKAPKNNRRSFDFGRFAAFAQDDKPEGFSSTSEDLKRSSETKDDTSMMKRMVI